MHALVSRHIITTANTFILYDTKRHFTNTGGFIVLVQKNAGHIFNGA